LIKKSQKWGLKNDKIGHFLEYAIVEDFGSISEGFGGVQGGSREGLKMQLSWGTTPYFENPAHPFYVEKVGECVF